MTHSETRSRVLVIGNCHQTALRHAYETRVRHDRPEGLECRFIPFHNDTYRPIVVGSQFQPSILAELGADDLRFVVSTIGGNDHNLLGLVNHRPVKFDFVLPEAPDLALQEDADVVPFELVRRTLLARLAETFSYMTLLQSSTSAPLYHLESPPPVPSEEYIRQNPDACADLIAEYGVAPATLRYKLWRLHSSLVREACESGRYTFVPSPQAMQDDHGMLVPEAWRNDSTHANEVYGEHLYRQLLAIVERRFSANTETS